MSNLTAEDIKLLSEPFDEKTIGVKVQSFNKERTRAMLVCYIQHTDVYARLDQVDAAWKAEVTDTQFLGESCFVRVRLTVKEVSRENAGEGGDPKSAISDAIKRAAMLFGVGRYLYDSETVWVPYNEATDRYRVYTLADHKAALRPGQASTPTSKPATQGALAPAPVKPLVKDRKTLGSKIASLQRQLQLNEEELLGWIQELFQTTPQNMTIPQMEKFIETLEIELGRQGVSA